jgi:hypothetical protein
MQTPYRRCKVSLFFRKNSLLSLEKFPVVLRREFAGKPLNLLMDWAQKSHGHGSGRNLRISLLISLLAGNFTPRRVRR